MPVSFCTPIESDSHPFTEFIDNYLSFGTVSAEVISPGEFCSGGLLANQKVRVSDFWTTVLKISTMVLSAGILPLLALIAKAINRGSYEFYWKDLNAQASQKSEPSREPSSGIQIQNNSHWTYTVTISSAERSPLTASIYPWEWINFNTLVGGHSVQLPREFDIDIHREGSLVRRNTALQGSLRIYLDHSVDILFDGHDSEERYLQHLSKQPSPKITEKHVLLVGNAITKHFKLGIEMPVNDIHLSFSNLYCAAHHELITSGQMTLLEMWAAFKENHLEDESLPLNKGAYLALITYDQRKVHLE
jgi:hypothetical protein